MPAPHATPIPVSEGDRLTLQSSELMSAPVGMPPRRHSCRRDPRDVCPSGSSAAVGRHFALPRRGVVTARAANEVREA
jgi:hypothetical protein